MAAGAGAAGRALTHQGISASDVRIVLARTYLQTGGPKSIPLPSVTQVINGRRVTLPQCPAARNRDLSLDARAAAGSLARGKESLRRVIERMRMGAHVARLGRFPYRSWWLPVDVKTLNIAFPDSNAVYWVLPLYVPVQQEVVLNGTFPDARYISFALYNQNLDPCSYTPPGGGRSIKSYIADYQIRPDPGSLNPWRTAGAQPGGTSPVPWPNRLYQMRYWSMCSAVYERPYPTIIDSGCLVNNDVITDAKGFYTVVVSSARARPSTADEQHGVNWIRVRPGVANLLILRNMLGGGFRYSTQNVPKDGSWQTAYLSMRRYYPTVTVECTTAHYEADGWQGCVAPKGSGIVGRRN